MYSVVSTLLLVASAPLALAETASSSPTAKHVFKRRMSSPAEARSVGVHYDVVHHHKVTPVGVEAHLGDYAHATIPTGVMCGSDDLSLTLFFESRAKASAWADAVGEDPTLVGSCTVKETSGEQRPVRLRALTATLAEDSKEAPGFFELQLVGAKASMNDIFFHANVTAQLEPEEEIHLGSDGSRQLAQLASYGKDCDVHDIASGNCTEQFKGQTVRLPSVVNWNSNERQLFSSGGVMVKTRSSSVKITPTVYFELGISLSKINKFSIAIKGTLQASSGVGIEASASKSISKELTITTVNLPIVSFSIGAFPFVIAPSVPIKAGVFFAVNGKASYAADASYSGSMSAGVSLSGSSLRPKTSINFPSPRKSTPSFRSSAEVQVTAKAWLSAALTFNVQGLAQLGVKATQTISSFAKVGTSGPLSAQVDGNFDVVVNGALGAKLAGISIPPSLRSPDKTVYSKAFLLWKK